MSAIDMNKTSGPSFEEMKTEPSPERSAFNVSGVYNQRTTSGGRKTPRLMPKHSTLPRIRPSRNLPSLCPATEPMHPCPDVAGFGIRFQGTQDVATSALRSDRPGLPGGPLPILCAPQGGGAVAPLTSGLLCREPIRGRQLRHARPALRPELDRTEDQQRRSEAAAEGDFPKHRTMDAQARSARPHPR